MSKHSSSRLTPSRKKRRQPARLDTDWLDAVNNHRFHLEALAELLAACGQPLNPKVLANAGCWMSQELRALKALLDKLEAAR